jgi:hypothetical protein
VREALAALEATPAATVAFLKGRLRPVAAADPKRVERLLRDLDGKQFGARQAAMRELENLGDLAAAALEKRLTAPLSLEARRRIESLRARLDGPPPAPVMQALRAIEVLERIGTPEARQVLEALAQGAAGHRVTAEAAASVRRLKSAH